MEEAHLIVQPHALQGAHALRHQQTVAEAEQRIDGVSRWPSGSCRETKLGGGNRFGERAKVDSGGIAFDASHLIRSVHGGKPCDALSDGFASGCQLLAHFRVRRIPRPSTNHRPAVLELRCHGRLGQCERMGVVHGCAKERGSQMYVAVRWAAYREAKCAAHAQRRHPHTATNAGIQRLRGELRAAQHDKCINRLQGNPLAALWRSDDQRSSSMLYASTMIANVRRAQVAHWNTKSDTYLLTFRGAPASSGRQWPRSWHSLQRSSFGAEGRSPVSSCSRIVPTVART